MLGLPLTFAILLISASSSFAATLHLTDGSKLQGTILKETPEAVEIQTPDGTLTIKRERIILLEDGAKPTEAPPAAPAPAAAPTPTPSPIPPSNPTPVGAPARKRRITLALDILGAGNAADALQKDFQLGAAAVGNLGYTTSGSVKTTGAVGFRGSYLTPVSPKVDLGGSIGIIGGPNSEGTLAATGGALSATLQVEREISWVRFLVEERTRFEFSDRTTFYLGGGIGIASGRVEQQFTCRGSACKVNNSKTAANANWSGFTWELVPEMTYRSLLVGLRMAGMPTFKGNSDLSKIEWTTLGLTVGFFFH